MDTRDQIRSCIYANTGIHFNALVRESAFATGQVQYHIRQLLDTGEIVRGEFYGQTHYYPPEYNEQEQAVLALLRRGTAREIVVYLLDHGPTTPSMVATALDIARGTLEYHLDRLIEHTVVEKTYDDQKHVQLQLENPKRMAKLLSIVDPRITDQLADGLSCLVDDLFESACETE
jgi:predicted transcriptional regulator